MAIRTLDFADDGREKTTYALVFLLAILTAVVVTLLVAGSLRDERYAPRAPHPPATERPAPR
ncbi:MAG: hypothetical protein AMXMBFR64_52940 [Myxococcales bacterium]